jgi:nitrite reductase/ring-hydroxylating ferredoxin subunit
MAGFVKCADLGELAPGSCRIVNPGGRDLALFNVDGNIFCLDNTCLHRGGPLGEGDLDGEIVTCPWHGWQYNVRTGELLIDPSVKIGTYPVRVEGNEIQVEV